MRAKSVTGCNAVEVCVAKPAKLPEVKRCLSNIREDSSQMGILFPDPPCLTGAGFSFLGPDPVPLVPSLEHSDPNFLEIKIHCTETLNRRSILNRRR